MSSNDPVSAREVASETPLSDEPEGSEGADEESAAEDGPTDG